MSVREEGEVGHLNLETLWYEQERQELLRAFDEEHGSTQGRIIPHDLPLPKLSEVLRCVQLAMAEPQIWEWAQKEAFRTDDDFERDGSRLFSLLMLSKDWFRLKEGLYNHSSVAFVRIFPTLLALGRNEFNGNKIDALRHFLENYPAEIYIDDLSDGVSSDGGAA